MPTKRPTLAEFSPEVHAHNIQGQKLNEAKHAATEDYRRKLAAPNNTADRTDRIARLAKGEVIEPVIDDAAAKRNAANLCRDLVEACDLHHKQSQPIEHKARAALCKTLLPDEREMLKEAATGLGKFHAAFLNYHELKHYLLAEGGLVGICLTDFEKLFGNPTDRNSNLGMLFQELVKLGALDKMPAGLK
jgi:hypothetical protein